MITKQILDHFKKNDSIIYTAARKIKEPLTLTSRTSYFESLCDSIIGQQLSTKVGDVLSDRFRGLFHKRKMSPEIVARIQPEQLRAIGISNAKAKYIVDLSQKIMSGEVSLEKLDRMENDKIMEELTKVKGIGPWTVEMFLMFTLARPDIFSFGDLGLKRAIQKLYGLKKEPTPKKLAKLSSKWSPYRTYAAMILWRSLDF